MVERNTERKNNKLKHEKHFREQSSLRKRNHIFEKFAQRAIPLKEKGIFTIEEFSSKFFVLNVKFSNVGFGYTIHPQSSKTFVQINQVVKSIIHNNNEC